MPRFRFVGTEETREDVVRGIEGEFWEKVCGKLSFLESGKGRSQEIKNTSVRLMQSSEKKQPEMLE